MVVLAPLWPAGGWPAPDVHAMAMATDMTIGDGAVDAHPAPLVAADRRDVRRDVPAVPRAAGAVLAGRAVRDRPLMIAGHVIMFPLMLAAMVWRRAEYWH